MEVVPSKKVEYPDNLTLNNLAYFLVVPALVYQTSFPMSKRFRGRYIIWYDPFPLPLGVKDFGCMRTRFQIFC